MDTQKIWRVLRLVLLSLIGPVVLAFFFLFFIKTTEEYSCVLQTVQQDPDVVKALGEPVEPGLFAWMPFFESGGHVRQGYFTTTVSGPRGKGKIKADFYRAPVGSTLEILFEFEGDETVLYSGPYVCPD